MTQPLDPAGDPDRYDPARDVPPSGPLDWALDPDRYDPAMDAARPPLPTGRTGGRRSTLPELIGKDASFQDNPSPYIWLLGLIGTVLFLLLVAFVFSHLSP
ncbi:MAG: hypothetical protein NVS3B18_08250 [Candidatus Dormibacteria bacterium]